MSQSTRMVLIIGDMSFCVCMYGWIRNCSCKREGEGDGERERGGEREGERGREGEREGERESLVNAAGPKKENVFCHLSNLSLFHVGVDIRGIFCRVRGVMGLGLINVRPRWGGACQVNDLLRRWALV